LLEENQPCVAPKGAGVSTESLAMYLTPAAILYVKLTSSPSDL
jgi:hypothetical protein